MPYWFLPFLVQESIGFIDGNAVQPRGNSGISAELIQVGPAFQKRILKHIVGIVVRENHLSDLPVKAFGIILYQQVECLIALTFVAEHFKQ